MRETRLPHTRLAIAGLLVSMLMAAPASSADTKLAPLPDAKKVNADKVELGRKLFFDARLSGDTATSCATCHDPAKGWGDGKPLSNGYTSIQYFRNAPNLFNAGHRSYFMWDGRLDGSDAGTLVRDMLTEAHTMNMDSRLAQERLKQVPEYQAMFEKAFKGDPYGGKIYGAIGEYLKTIRTVDAPLDKYLRGDKGALGEAALRGMALFEGKAGCVQCHFGATLSDGKVHATGVPANPELDKNAERQISMLRHFSTQGTPNYMNLREDVGHYVVTKDKKDWAKFLTSSLWDIGQTAPYMHNGVFATLEDVVAFYNGGGGEKSGMKPLQLSDAERADLVAFLKSMTGKAPTEKAPVLPDYKLRTVGKN
ncbi:MAG: c-type cytochrome [Hyphomicrobiaceae bacterium]|nr:c-type cytochrome [Hyphomicrobiaceae bacterium]